MDEYQSSIYEYALNNRTNSAWDMLGFENKLNGPDVLDE